MKIYRHGDLLIREIKSIPRGAKKVNTRVLAYGEVTGHRHEIISEKDVFDLLERSGMRYLKVKDGKVELTHQEHKTIEILVGKYEIIREREYDYFNEEIERVKD